MTELVSKATSGMTIWRWGEVEGGCWGRAGLYERGSRVPRRRMPARPHRSPGEYTEERSRLVAIPGGLRTSELVGYKKPVWCRSWHQ
jgi:hypothetical protein